MKRLLLVLIPIGIVWIGVVIVSYGTGHVFVTYNASSESRPVSSTAPTPKITSKAPSASPTVDASTSHWSFLVMADTHGFGKLSWNDLEENKQTEDWIEISKVLTNIRNSYGGELVLLPGDQVSYGTMDLQQFVDRLNGNSSPQEAVYKAAIRSHKAIRAIFKDVGYDTILATIGDHEIGGNEGFMRRGRRSKVSTIPSHRHGFGDGVNRNEDGDFLFDQSFDGVTSRPLGTAYENTTCAYVHRNALFVTVDAFELLENRTEDYIDRESGLGGEGVVTCTVSGDHLDWFENILSYGRDNLGIDHIFVQAHLPIIQPVQKVDTSGQFFDRAAESDFWRLMNEYGVDIYFAGDVHANTATRSRYVGSNLVQIISRGNRFNNFLTLDVSKDIIDVKIYNEFGDKWRFNGNYEISGHLRIDKSFEVTKILSGGMLELLDANLEIISFDFEEIYPLGTRQVISLGDRENIMVKEVMIRERLCTDSMFNKGGFGAQYDAQLCNISLIEGRNEGGFAGLFGDDSRFGLYGTGPFSGGEIISLGIWFKTTEASKRMLVVHYGNYWGSVRNMNPKDHFTLTLDHGVPVVNVQPTIQLRPSDEMNLADGSWHHIGISMPRKSCMVSELDVYVDGKLVAGTIVGGDRHIFYTTSGRSSLGGFGYSNTKFEEAYRDVGPFIGAMDDFVLFARPLRTRLDFPTLYPFVENHGMSCNKSDLEEYVIVAAFEDCRMLCLEADWCLGFERALRPEESCVLFEVLPRVGGAEVGTTCYQAGWLWELFDLLLG